MDDLDPAAPPAQPDPSALNCPYCGSSPRLIQVYSSKPDDHSYRYACNSIYEAPEKLCPYRVTGTPEEALAAWNTRT